MHEFQSYSHGSFFDFTFPECLFASFLKLDELTVSDLRSKLQMDDISFALEFWVSQGILKQFDDVVVSINSCPQDRIKKLMKTGSSRRHHSKPSALQDQAHLLPMIISFLTNMGPNPLSNINRTLKMLCFEPFPYRLSEPELEQFLNSLVLQGNLDFDGSKYKVKK